MNNKSFLQPVASSYLGKSSHAVRRTTRRRVTNCLTDSKWGQTLVQSKLILLSFFLFFDARFTGGGDSFLRVSSFHDLHEFLFCLFDLVTAEYEWVWVIQIGVSQPVQRNGWLRDDLLDEILLVLDALSCYEEEVMSVIKVHTL